MKIRMECSQKPEENTGLHVREGFETTIIIFY